MSSVPPKLGSPEWLAAESGILSRPQRFGQTARTIALLPQLVWHRSRAQWFWRKRATSGGSFPEDWDREPEGRLAQMSAERCRSLLSVPMIHHSYRTWAFGRALALQDGCELDDELFFVAAMLHDVGLARAEYGRCFTATGVHAAEEIGAATGCEPDRIATAARAISHHITPGLSRSDGGDHALYIQRGSVMDLSGLRAHELPVDWVRSVCAKWPTHGVRLEAGARWRAESAMVRHGRAHHLQRCGFSLICRFTPIPPDKRLRDQPVEPPTESASSNAAEPSSSQE